MINLNTTSALKSKKIRPGRGIGSGKGKTSGRGHKGQKSRRGVAIKSFEGGQMPLYRRLPKRGFNPIKSIDIAKINIGNIQSHIDNKKIKASETINIELLKKNKLINKNSQKVKILGSGDLKDKIILEVDFISKSVKAKLDKTGSTLKIKK
ncbi:MAG: 50S ribosomal protein L15 [Candidatus Pelagibacter sp.]|jgi:large subunit ribosomal protein L15|nr:50S ribosomal protein L15 [Candidatus Pelagibacter sp.]RZO51070.1 MAG: 50S ribosomal protein L15 [Pelagibacterales bacterium]|tara:strand:- start:2652 stop:3104 length:453 start_codon:yes stop_codon:yes gene_type:complete